MKPTRNGILTNHHHYVSGVAVLRREQVAATEVAASMEENEPLHNSTDALLAALAAHEQNFSKAIRLGLDVYDSASNTAAPIPRTLFTGEHDTRWAASGGGFQQLQLNNGAWT